MKTVLFSIMSILIGGITYATSDFSGCTISSPTSTLKMTLKSSDAIGQSFKPCDDGFLSHFSIFSGEINTHANGLYINIYEVVNNQFKFISQEQKDLPAVLPEGKQTFWITERIPVYAGREYAVEFLNLSDTDYELKFNRFDEHHSGSMIKNGKFTFSDLSFDAGIKHHIKPQKNLSLVEAETPEVFADEHLLQSWSNKNINVKYGEIGQGFGTDQEKEVVKMGIKIKNSKIKQKFTLEFYEHSVSPTNLIHEQEVLVEAGKGEKWEQINLTKPLTLHPNIQYCFNIRMQNVGEGIKLYYSTANPLKSGDIRLSGLELQECDLSFYLESKTDDFLKEIEWLEVNDYEEIEKSPLSVQLAQKNKLDVTIYPNPFDGQFMLTHSNFRAGKTATIAITSSSGALLWMNDFMIESDTGVMNIDPQINLTSGKYNLRISHNNELLNIPIYSK